MRDSSIVVAVGPAGCGKTMLATLAARQQHAEEGKRVVVTRPIRGVEEEYGYLPGSIDTKFAPWLHPVREHLHGCPAEVAPLAFMRGRTFTNAFVVADEMQNASVEQVKMLLTRIGPGTTVVITGDPDQCDVPESGLVDLLARLSDNKTLKHLRVVRLTDRDVRRHPAVREVLTLYRRESPGTAC